MGRLYAIRGATTVEENTEAVIREETLHLLERIWKENHLQEEEIISIFFTMTPDLNATFPAEAAREMGLHHIPLLCSVEIDVAGATKRCIRVLLHVAGDGEAPVKHIYLNRAKSLRPDWCNEERSGKDATSA